MNKILLSEPIDKAGVDILEGKAEIIVSPDPSDATVGALLRDADALIVRTATRISREMIQEARNLKVISRTGGGLNNVDVEAATECNVVVAGVKGAQDRPVAEHAVFLMGALAKQFPYLDGQVRKGNFKSRFEYRPTTLSGKHMGLIGLGRIGRIVADICMAGFEMRVVAYDPYVDAQTMSGWGIRALESMDEVLKTADFVSLHVPATKETTGLMGPEQFALMKPTAFVINTSRGEIIQEGALVEALRSGQIAGAGLDVFEKEPPDQGNPLLEMENVIMTPHTAALSKDTVSKLAEGSALNALSVLDGKAPTFSANWDIVQSQLKQ